MEFRGVQVVGSVLFEHSVWPCRVSCALRQNGAFFESVFFLDVFLDKHRLLRRVCVAVCTRSAYCKNTLAKASEERPRCARRGGATELKKADRMSDAAGSTQCACAFV